MLDVPVTEVVLQSPCVVAIIGELKTTGMAQHVWVDGERSPRRWMRRWKPIGTALGNEYVGIFEVVAA